MRGCWHVTTFKVFLGAVSVAALVRLAPPADAGQRETNVAPPENGSTAAEARPAAAPHAPKEGADKPGPGPSQTAPPEEKTAWSDEEIKTARADCSRLLGPIAVDVEATPPVRAGECGLPGPVRLKRIGPKPGVQMRPPIVLNCTMVARISEWVEKVVQPAARDGLGSPVVAFINPAGYQCRFRNSASSGTISEHAFANALDVSEFVLANGKHVDVFVHWGPTARDRAKAAAEAATKADTETATDQSASEAQGSKGAMGTPAVPARKEETFLKRIHKESCGLFSTVLGPEANDFHRTHMHFDLVTRQGSALCE